MTIFLETPRRPSALTIAGGEAGLGAIAGAGRDSLLYVDNGNSAHAALDRAIEDRIERIHAATGVKAENPLRKAEDEWRIAEAENLSAVFSGTGGERRSLQDVTQQHIDRFEGDLFALGEKFPDARQAIGADRPLFEDAKRIAREADERLSQLMDSRGGLAKYGALLAGGMVGALNDPITLASLMAGAGPGAARTVAGRILSVAGKEAMINAGTETVVQAGVQKWREEVGLDHGLDQAIQNVLFAGLLGGAFGTAGQGIAEGARRFVRPADIERVAESLRNNDRLTEPARAILNNDGLRAAESLATIRDQLPAEARGAIDQAAIIRATDAQRPAAARADVHDMAVATADRMVRMPDAEQWQPFPVDDAQIARVTREIVGPDVYDAAPTERSLTGFLIDRGGISDFRGELRAIGADTVSERFRGRLMRDDGDSLDYAREAAAEAGYFDQLYGTPDEATARSTVADLLDLLEEDIRGNPVTPGMAARTDAADFEAARAGVEGIVSEIARLAGPAVDDAVLARAARIAMDEGGDPFDALERVLMTDELGVRYVRGFRDTRGDGQQFHGSGNVIEGLYEGAYNDRNIYGQGFYTSDAFDIVDGYSNRRGSSEPTIYTVHERTPVRMFDMEEPIPDWLIGDLDDYWSDGAELIEVALSERPANTRELYDEIRAFSGSYGVSRDEVQDLFDTFATTMQERGYGGLRHIGGLRTNNDPHNVQIYFRPEEQIEIRTIDPADFRVNAGPRTTDDLPPGWSDAELLARSEERGAIAEPDGIDDPIIPRPDDEISDADIAAYRAEGHDTMIDDAGNLVPIDRYLADIARDDELANIMKACRA